MKCSPANLVCALFLALIALCLCPPVSAGEGDSVVVFNEVQYHPLDGEPEWIELKNLLGVDVDLSGWYFREGITFQFPEGTVIPGRGYLVVASAPGHVSLNGVGALGPFTQVLDNGGERLELANRNGRVMDVLDYETTEPWPAGPDESGSTLASIRKWRVPNAPAHWTSSEQIGGTPGAENFPTGLPEPTLTFHEISGASDGLFQVEITNRGSSPVLLDGVILRNSSSLALDYVFPNGSGNLPPGAFVVVDETDLGVRPAEGNRLFLLNATEDRLLDGRRVDDRLRGSAPERDHRWLYPAFATFGSANVFSFQEDIVINEIMYHASPQPAEPGDPGVAVEVELIDYADPWLYNESGAALPAGWAQTGYSAGSGGWQSGAGPLAYEPHSHPVPANTTLTDPSLNSPYVVTYYFQKEFTLSAQDLQDLDSLELTHVIDDGAVFYLNGVEVLRYGMPGGAVTSTTEATLGGEAEIIGPVQIPTGNLVAGSNTLSVEVHQTSTSSSDVYFGLELEAILQGSGGTPPAPFQENPEEWVELYNRGLSTVDLSGWRFSEGIGFTFPPGTTLAAGQYLVVTADAAALQAKHPGITILGDYSASLSGAGELVVLEDAAGNPADEVRYFDGGRWPDAADGKGSTLELIDAFADNTHPASWRASDESARGVWTTFTWSGQPGNGLHGPAINGWQEFVFGLNDDGTFLIDDISVIEDPDGAALELIQNGDFTSGTADSWRIIGNHRHFEIVDDPDAPGNPVLKIRATGTTEHVHNHASTTLKNGGTIRNIDPNETYRISLRARWVSGGRSLNARLYHNRLARSHILPVTGTPGSPGQVNPGSMPNAGPVFTAPTHSPIVPAAGNSVEISIRAEDPQTVSALTLHYAINDGAWQTAAMTLGADGLWNGQIPGTGRVAGDQAQFFVEGEDGLGATSTWPADGENSRAIVRWDDGLAQLQVNGVEPTNFRILMTDADADWMHESGNAMSNDMLGATVILNETDVYYDVGVRIKGSPRGRTVPDRVGYSLRFPADEPFMGIHERISVDRSGPDELTSVREILFKHAVNHAAGGVPSTYDDVIRVIAPNRIGSEDAGVYFPSVHIEAAPALLNASRYDDELLENQWEDGDEGEVFEYELIYRPALTVDGDPESLKVPRRSASGSIYRHDFEDIFGSVDKELYRWHWLIKNNRAEDRFDHLIQFVSTMGNRSNPDFHEDLRQLMDTDQWLRATAFHILFGVSDSYTGSSFSVGLGHNMAIYFRPEDDKALFLPWDSDFAFKLSETLPISNHAQLGDDLDYLIQDPANKRLYYGHLLDIITTSFNTTYLGIWSSHYTKFSDGENLTQFDTYVSTRAAHVQGLVSADIPPAAFAITTPDNTSTDDYSLAITGNGWVNIREIRRAGSNQPLPVTWTTETTWRVLVPVQNGSQLLTLEAYDFQGNFLSSDSVTIIGTQPVELADSTNLVISEIHYHPADPSAAEIAAGFTDKDDFEFLELLNIGAETVNLAGVSFIDGIDYNFGPDDVFLPAGGRLLLVEDAAAFTKRYGAARAALIHDQWSGGLSNGGEHLILRSSTSGVIRSFSYSDDSPWPTAPDGDGPSLVLVDPFSNPDHSLAINWRASLNPGGEPGESNPPAYADWAAGHYTAAERADPAISGPLANSDGGPLSNLLEYVFDLDPWLVDGLDVIETFTVNEAGQDYLAIRFTIAADREDISYSGQVTSQLSTWPGENSPIQHATGSPQTNPDGSLTVTLRDTVPTTDNPTRFIRALLKKINHIP